MSNPNDKQEKQGYTFHDDDREVTEIINELKAGTTPASEAPAAPTEPVLQTPAAPDVVRLTAQGAETPAPRRRKESRAGRLFRNLIPQWGDIAVEVLRKCLFMLAFLTLVSSAVYLIHDTIWIPTQNKQLYDGLQETFHKGLNGTEEEHRKAMEDLYAKNSDFRAWLTYKSTGTDFLQIDYPVVYSGDNSYYLEHDFNKNYNKNGALFFDERNNYALTSSDNKVSIIYGHNMNSGQMFNHLNLFLEGVERAKAAPLIQLDTMQGTEKYKVFAIIVTNTKASDGPVFNYLRTSFADDEDFLNYVNEYRARSLYDYDDVSVSEDDQLLVLSTCTTEGGVSFDDGRLAVIARKVRVGESEEVDTTTITDNGSVIMPYAWYKNQGLTPHAYYDGAYDIPTATVTEPVATQDVADATTPQSEAMGHQTVTPTTAPPAEMGIGSDGRTTRGKVTVGSYTNKKTTTTKAPTTTKAAE